MKQVLLYFYTLRFKNITFQYIFLTPNRIVSTPSFNKAWLGIAISFDLGFTELEEFIEDRFVYPLNKFDITASYLDHNTSIHIRDVDTLIESIHTG